MKVEFKGVVSTGDKYRSSSDPEQGAIFIGGEDVVDEIHERGWSGDVVAILNGEKVAEGSEVSEIGWGYSSWTPMDSDMVQIGGTDLIAILEGYEGREVTLIVTDDRNATEETTKEGT